jgi:hypothetical protein
VQWDVARPVFEATAAAARYPVRAGVTHALIRKAIGHWVRRAVASWDAAHPGGRHLLIGEAPFVGNRFVELARRADDRAEPLLASPACRFVIPVPSRSVRAFLEAERERRAAEPLHERERHDAPPSVLRDLWRELLHVAVALGLASAPADDASPAWDPDVYRAVYEALLRHRHADVVPVETVLSTRSFSVYDFAVPPIDVVPGADEATTCIRDVEARYPDPDALERDVARWYVV